MPAIGVGIGAVSGPASGFAPGSRVYNGAPFAGRLP